LRAKITLYVLNYNFPKRLHVTIKVYDIMSMDCINGLKYFALNKFSGMEWQ
jgi:hypothetical protein